MANSQTQISTAIVVPCFNEQDRLELVHFLDFCECQPTVHFLFVNDGSTDGTQLVLERLRTKSPQNFSIHRLDRNCGKGEAVRQGLEQAITLGAKYIGFWDADLATPLNAIPKFVSVLQERPDIQAVLGCRLPLIGRQVQRQPFRARLGKTFAWLAAGAIGVTLSDTQCGAKLFRNGPGLAAIIQKPFSSKWIFDVELIIRMMLLEQRITGAECSLYEYPLDQWSEKAGSKLQPRHVVQSGFDLAYLYWKYSGPRRKGLQNQFLTELRNRQPTTSDNHTIPQTISIESKAA